MFSLFSGRSLAGFLCCLLLWPVGVAVAEPLSVRADYWYPLNGEPDSERPGFAIEILRGIFSDSEWEIDYQLADWSRSLELARDGRIDCVVGVYRSEAPKLAYPETPLAWDTAAFYVRADSDWRYHDPSSLQDVSVGLIAGYGYGEKLDRYIVEHRGDERLRFMHGHQPLRRNLKKLMRGRVDVLVESPFVMESQLRRMGLSDQVREAGRVGQRMPLYFACNPDREGVTGLLSDFDRGMRELRETGEVGEIMSRYKLPDSVVGGPVPGGDD